MPLLIKGPFNIFFTILYIAGFWVLIIRRVFKESLCIFNIGLAFGVFSTLGSKLECSCFVIRSFNFSSAGSLFIVALDCFLYHSGLFNSCSTTLSTCFLLIMHVALSLSASNKHKSLLLSHLFMSLQTFS